MLFNSYEFLLFLPITVIGFFLAGRVSPAWALRWLCLASLFFYAWWRPANVLIILPSILFNYALAKILLRCASGEASQRHTKPLLILGIVFNLCFLGYFKYANFLLDTANTVFGANLVLTQLILPLGISFITFQKIAFLFDVKSRRIKSFSFQDYCTFVLFFPQLIAGPIVHYNELMPQFHKATYRFEKENLAVGLTLFSFGLFKKLVLADSIAPYINEFYNQAAGNVPVGFAQAWIAAIGFTLQIYFDFSGYSDMALGLARLFGISLPANFNSPLKASSIIDFWSRWHMTLTRFLTGYLYNPMALAVTRRRAANGLPGLGGRHTSAGSFVTVLMFPLLVTMSLAGLWHGAGWNFVIFGALHGIYLTINHAWRLFRPKTRSDGKGTALLGSVVVLTAILFANVFFRSASTSAAFALLKGMLGFNGVTLPMVVFDRLGPAGDWLQGIGIRPVWWSGYNFTMTLFWIGILSIIAFIPPNTLQIMASVKPALNFKFETSKSSALMVWRPTPIWAFSIALISAAGFLSLGKLSAFLYWQF